MATNWEAKFGKGKWVTVRGARVYIQEGKGLRSTLSKLSGSKKTIKSPIRKAPQVSDTEKKIIGNNEKTIVNAKKKFGVRMNPIVDQVGDENNKDAYVALGKARAAREINRELKGRNPDGNWGGTGASDYNNKKEPRAFARDRNLLQSHERRVKEGILDAQKARKAAGTDGKLRSPVYADQKTGKLKLASKPLGKGTKTFTNEKDRKDVENNVVKRNEEKIKKYNQTDPNTDWEEFVKIDDAARHARNENQKIKAKNEPGRGQTISDYRNPQFTKGDNLSPVGNRHVTSRVTPDASKTGEADQELNQLYAQRRPYGNRTYNDPTLKGSWEDSVKTVIKNARATRKANGTEGKLRSDVYKSAPQPKSSESTGKAKNTAPATTPKTAKSRGPRMSEKDAQTIEKNEKYIQRMMKRNNAKSMDDLIWDDQYKVEKKIDRNRKIKEKYKPGRGNTDTETRFEWEAPDYYRANVLPKYSKRDRKAVVKQSLKFAHAIRTESPNKLRSPVYASGKSTNSTSSLRQALEEKYKNQKKRK